MGSGSLSTGRKPWECQNSSQGCVWVSVCKLTSACVQKCLCVQWLSFCLAPQSPDDINSSQGKLRVVYVGLRREQQAAIIKTFFFFFLAVVQEHTSTLYHRCL